MHKLISNTDLRPINDAIVYQAISWRVNIESSEYQQSTIDACNQWRACHPDHEIAWQRLQQIDESFDKVSTTSDVVQKTLLKTDVECHQINRRQAIKRITTSSLSVAAIGLFAHQQGAADFLQSNYNSHHNANFYTLNDTSQLWLNRDSAVAVDLSPQQHLLMLHRGEMQLTVATTNQPFNVHFPFGQLSTNQSRFFIRDGGDHSLLQVIEGEVILRVQGSQQLTAIQSGQLYRLSSSETQTLHITTFDYTSWIDGIFSVRNMPLKSFLVELSRYHNGLIRCDKNLENHLISGVYQLKNIESILKTVALSAGANVRYITRWWAKISL